MSDSRSVSPHAPRERSPAPQKRTSLLVRNIVSSNQDQSVKPDDLREYFSKFGEVRDVYIPRDYHTQRSRGFCFVEFLKYDEAKEALEKTDGNELLGKTAKIVFAREGRKAPQEMRKRDRNRRSSSPRRRHYRRSRTPPRYRKRRDSYSSSRTHTNFQDLLDADAHLHHLIQDNLIIRMKSSYQSSKVSDLLDYLESQDTESRLEYLDHAASNVDSLSAFSEAKVKMMSLKLELEEANKTIESLKAIIDKLKYQSEEQERFLQDKFDRELARVQKSYDESLEKNMGFIESLLKEKELRLKTMNELQAQITVNEENYKNSVNKLQESFKKEMKKAKDSWVTTEKVKREKWEKEKTKEIKEMTARGLEPEINRIVLDNRRKIDEMEEMHKKELKNLRETLEDKHNDDMKKLRDNLNYKHDLTLEKEREMYSKRIKEMTLGSELRFYSNANNV